MLHPQRQLHHQLCGITADSVAGCNSGDVSAAALDQGQSKLLLAHVPNAYSTDAELKARVQLWLVWFLH